MYFSFNGKHFDVDPEAFDESSDGSEIALSRDLVDHLVKYCGGE